MALTLTDLKAHANVTGNADDAVLARYLSAAISHVGRLLGFDITDGAKFPGGTPADLELAVLQLAADWYENREATLVGVASQPIPFGIKQIVDEYRNYTFGLSCEADGDG